MINLIQEGKVIVIYTVTEVKHKVDSLLKEFGTNDVYEICQQLNICINTQPLGRIDGFLQYYKNKDVFIIHVNETIEDKLFTIARELGLYFLCKTHALIEKCSRLVLVEDGLVRPAGVFASELLGNGLKKKCVIGA
ncbi:hypothetical protein ASE42_14415 [Bacillus sp. Root920]|uniref:hypothetical protein n=1 Tax=Bacillus TaxID=1386 RepID=UPI0006F9B195|nr:MULTISPECIES: hypothetical protein [Bacillus]KRE14213.1 hypothetical protein ASE42_14415 [Bacillus sp. Root920]MDM5318586.1 hypothetical protein [Bacillus pumilus]